MWYSAFCGSIFEHQTYRHLSYRPRQVPSHVIGEELFHQRICCEVRPVTSRWMWHTASPGRCQERSSTKSTAVINVSDKTKKQYFQYNENRQQDIIQDMFLKKRLRFISCWMQRNFWQRILTVLKCWTFSVDSGNTWRTTHNCWRYELGHIIFYLTERNSIALKIIICKAKVKRGFKEKNFLQ